MTVPGKQNPAATGEQTECNEQNALRVKVAELCPAIFDIHETGRNGRVTKYVSWKDDKEIQEREWLAACAEFEKGLTEDQQYRYIGFLAGKHWAERWSFNEILTLTFATAEQRCRAFIQLHEGMK